MKKNIKNFYKKLTLFYQTWTFSHLINVLKLRWQDHPKTFIFNFIFWFIIVPGEIYLGSHVLYNKEVVFILLILLIVIVLLVKFINFITTWATRFKVVRFYNELKAFNVETVTLESSFRQNLKKYLILLPVFTIFGGGRIVNDIQTYVEWTYEEALPWATSYFAFLTVAASFTLYWLKLNYFYTFKKELYIKYGYNLKHYTFFKIIYEVSVLILPLLMLFYIGLVSNEIIYKLSYGFDAISQWRQYGINNYTYPDLPDRVWTETSLEEYYLDRIKQNQKTIDISKEIDPTTVVKNFTWLPLVFLKVKKPLKQNKTLIVKILFCFICSLCFNLIYFVFSTPLILFILRKVIFLLLIVPPLYFTFKSFRSQWSLKKAKNLIRDQRNLVSEINKLQASILYKQTTKFQTLKKFEPVVGGLWYATLIMPYLFKLSTTIWIINFILTIATLTLLLLINHIEYEVYSKVKLPNYLEKKYSHLSPQRYFMFKAGEKTFVKALKFGAATTAGLTAGLGATSALLAADKQLQNVLQHKGHPGIVPQVIFNLKNNKPAFAEVNMDLINQYTDKNIKKNYPDYKSNN